MKNTIVRLLALSAILTISACSPISTSSPSNSVETSSTTSSSEEKSSSSSSQRSSSSSSKQNSSSSQASVGGDNKLATTSGLVVSFKAEGATIDSITWKGKTVADRGFVVGRCANRIANGQFTLNGQQYNVSKNDGNNSLHGGAGSGMNSWRGPFATKNWTKEEETDSSITFSIESPDNENGYPGKMNMTVKYTLSEAGELSIEYTAATTKDTLCNPTNHLFMRMNGESSYSNLKLWIDADKYTPLNSSKIPTGQIVSVAGTQYDYTIEKAFDGSKKYDDNLVLNGTGYRKVATMTGTSLGLKVDVFTDRPGLQLYNEGSGNVCLETQMMPDAINHDNFESPILRAGGTFYSKTAYCFTSLK